MNPQRLARGGVAARPMNLENSQERISCEGDGSWVEQFLSSMPERYRQVFGREAIRLHARIARARGANMLHLEGLTATAIDEVPGLCVVAISFPGLLAAASAALAFEALDVIQADVYQRRTSLGDEEMLALFFLRPFRREEGACFDIEQLSRLKARMLELIRSQDFTPRVQESSYASHLQRGDAVASFRSVRGTTRSIIELHCRYHAGILAAVTMALAKQGVLIVDARIRSHGSRVHEYFEIEEPSGCHPAYARGPELLQVIVDAANLASAGSACTDQYRRSAMTYCSSGHCSVPSGAGWLLTSGCCA